MGFQTVLFIKISHDLHLISYTGADIYVKLGIGHTLDVIIKRAVCILVFCEETESIVVAKVLELNQTLLAEPEIM